jgi:transposase InsO family protein
MERGQAQMAYFRQMAERDWDVPGRGIRRFSPTAMKGWLYRYRKHGFAGLTPKNRKDEGKCRALSAESRVQIKKLREEHLEHSAVRFYDRCLKERFLGDPPICLETLRRFLKSENLYQPRLVTARKKFEMNYFGELWTCDFMHGPQVFEQAEAKRRRKAILLAIIDDHSRFIVGAQFGLMENTRLIEIVFKDAILAYGCPDRLYCDNGSAFSSSYLSRVCAHVGIGLVHSKPYDSPSRGKIERFFRTVRESFLVDVPEASSWDLKQLNDAFALWLREKYHHAPHRGIDARPIDRYQISTRNYPRKRIDEENLDEFFLVCVERTVAKDCTISLQGTEFEVPPQFIGKRVTLKFSQDHPGEIYLYEGGVRLQKIQPVNPGFNGKSLYQPSPRISNVALHELAQDGGAS